MNITDEKLSAFLDSELPETEMEVIREQLFEDENLANRLAELAMVDSVVAAASTEIDARPIPSAITALLAEDESITATNEQLIAKDGQTAKIIAFPLLKKIRHGLQQHATIAASVALVLGFGIAQMMPDRAQNDWQNIAQILENTPSGIVALSDDTEIKPRLTFVNQQGEYCRQFQVTNKTTASENIACRHDTKWQLTVSVTLDNVQQAGDYQTASGGSLLDDTVEQMAVGDFFNADAESIAIEKHWSTKKD